MTHHHGHNHLGIGFLIALATAAICIWAFDAPWMAPGYLAAGASFYAGREAMDWHRYRVFDRIGFYWPVVPLGGLDVALRVYTGDWWANLDILAAVFFLGVIVRELEKTHGWNWRAPKWLLTALPVAAAFAGCVIWRAIL